MKKLLLSLAVAGIVAGCSQSEAPKTEKSTDDTTAVQQVELGSGIDLTAMNTEVRPQDDFFNYVNGAWMARTEIPADKSSWGTFYELRDKSTEQVKALIMEASERAEGEDAEKIGALYNSFMDEKRIESRGLAALTGELQKVDAIKNRDDLTRYFAYADAIGFDAPFGVFINQDVKDVENYAVYLWQSGLGLPDRDYYFDDSDKGRQLQAAYIDFLTKLQQLAGMEDATKGAETIYALEKRLAEHQWTRVENRDDEKTYNKKSLKELATLLPAINWDIYLPEARLQKAEYVIVGQPDYLKTVNGIITDTDLDTWKRYLKVKLLTSMAPYMHSELAQLHFDFYSTKVRGIEEMEPRWKRAVQFVNGAAGELVGKRYVEKYFPPQAKARMVELVNNLKAAYKDSIESLDWMGEETKKRALEKLANFTTKIGYPDQWRDYSALQVSNDLVGNVLAARRFDSEYDRAKLGQPVDRSEWHMYPQTVNAYYNPPMNEIVFPAAILQPPFFNMAADDAVNYGAIGGVIGHEIGHGFDDQGSKYDGQGYLNNWWTDSDRANFEKLTAKLVDQYNAFEPLEGEHVNGALTLGENIGDLSGLGIAYKAYKMSLKGEEAPVIDGFTGDQRLFMGWAQVWRTKMRDEALSERLKTDPHSPAQYRVQGVLPNIDAFYKAFDVKEGDGMYLPKEERVIIW
ncbi:M13 family metallopeptidase [Microbulbifer thermotolerans]|uniref:M13 family metallopeptidase n=1 Tax=Microbulbifer thermotolerans TaxID=252514 RepID=UPI00224A5DEC|nr:M13 family metallopeptidase [Microbulbifer thermotolerans]MCX2779437.1 M13 family metallopeptidase [Microbulbifer thermotolerans]MCX2806118.1 M13 family metallopeptidase [Microbulbifer thermotolerans]MCX2842626.1 M13 family metallopeptidase [Microbulbifer thermotolerans]